MFARLSRIGEYAYIVQEYLLLHGCGQDRRAKILTGVKKRCVERPSVFPA